MARRTAWVDTLIDVDLTNAAQSLSSLLGTLTPIDTRATTVVRTLVDLQMVPTTLSTYAFQKISIGIGVASQDAFSVGVTAVPNPATVGDEPPRGWIYRAQSLVVNDSDQPKFMVRQQADIRAKRKVDNGELYLILTNTTALGTAFTVTIIGLVRTLLLLP